ncbi:MAG: efflux RND transporter periplasmic adaptor subunit, partial [Pseudomonadales bacterium]
YKKRKRLKEKSFVSDEELTQARTEQQRTEAVSRSAKFGVDVARYQLDAANTALQYSAAGDSNPVLQERVAIKAPVGGSVLKINRKSEGVVTPGAALLELGNPSTLEIAVDVLSFDAVRIKPGMAVTINRWGGEPLDGSVRLVEPVGETKISALGVEEQRVWVIVDIASPRATWQSLGDGYRVEASFIIWQADDVLQIPSASLFRKGKSWAVFVAVGGKARVHEVEVGEQNGLAAQILAGLDAGDQVITHPDAALSDGARVRQRE